MKSQAGRQAGSNFCLFKIRFFSFLFKSRQSVTGFQPRRWSPAHTTSEGARSSVWLASVRERKKEKKKESRVLKVESGTIPPFSWQFGVCRPTGAGLSRSRNFSCFFFLIIIIIIVIILRVYLCTPTCT
jgi:hypothetical protein